MCSYLFPLFSGLIGIFLAPGFKYKEAVNNNTYFKKYVVSWKQIYGDISFSI